MTQQLFKCLCLIWYFIPLLIADLLCIFGIEDGNVMLIVVGLFCMLYKACNIDLEWAGCKSTETHLWYCSFYLLLGMPSLQLKIGWSHVEAIAQSH